MKSRNFKGESPDGDLDEGRDEEESDDDSAADNGGEDSDDDHDMHIMRQLLEDFREERLSPSEREALMRAAGGQFTQLLTQHWKEKIQPTQVAGISLPPCLRSGLCCTDQSGEHSPYST